LEERLNHCPVSYDDAPMKPRLPFAPASSLAPTASNKARPTLADQAYDRIKGLIFDFRLMPGDRFSETELTEHVQVSRTPLRQALQRLQREGFLRVFPKLGWQVAPLDFDKFDELYDLRILLECHAVGRLCESLDRASLDSLTARWEVPANQRLDTPAAVRDLDEAFHHSLVEGSCNREMVRVHGEITDRIRIIRRLDFTKPSRIEATYAEHAAILRAIVRRRAQEAQRLLRAHIEQSKLEVRHITLDMLYRARQVSA
jgi:Transcriptional regulators